MAKQTLSENEIADLVSSNKKYLAKSNNKYLKYLIKKPDVTIEIYTTNTVVYRYKNNLTTKKNNLTKSASVQQQKILFSNQIGSDETGTGDLFGPVIFAAAYINDDIIKKLEDTTSYALINDSKKISDETIIKIVKEINDIVPHVKYIIDPEKFNEINDKFNMNEIKTIGHLAVLNKIYEQQPNQVYVDAFCSLKNWKDYIARHNLKQSFTFEELIFETKAESKYASVALASIFARYHLIEWFDDAEKELGCKIPKGAGKNSVDCYHALKNKNNLTKYVKLSWKSIK